MSNPAQMPPQLQLEPGESVVEVIPPGTFTFKVVALVAALLVLAASIGNGVFAWQKYERAEAKHRAALAALESEATNPPDWMKGMSPKRLEQERAKTRARLMVEAPSPKQALLVPGMSIAFSLVALGAVLVLGRRPPKTVVVTNRRAFVAYRKEDKSVRFASVASLAADSHGVHMTGAAGAINRAMADAAEQGSQLSPGYWSRAAGIVVHCHDGTVVILDGIPPSGLRRLGPAMATMLQQHHGMQQAAPHHPDASAQPPVAASSA
jgi:hypothetical protein